MINNSGKVWKYLLLLIIGIIIGGGVGTVVIRRIGLRNINRSLSVNATNVVTNSQSINDNKNSNQLGSNYSISDSRQNAIVEATKKVSPCVVGIIVTQLQVVGNSYYYEDFFDLFFAPKMRPQYQEVENMGSGFVISQNGLILTNNHVVENARKLYINFPDGTRTEGEIVGLDSYSDLAVVRVKGRKLKSVNFGDSDKLMIGQWAIAIGNPFLNFFNDPRPTVTVGVVSALERDFAPGNDVYYQGMIQTDAAINPGNSGGPLVNSDGEVIGINSFIYTGSTKNRGSIGIGFAIPSNRAKRVINELVRYGRRRPLWTGITVQDINRSIALTLGFDGTSGVVVTDVVKHSPGDIAGLKPNDVIVQMGKRLIRTHSDIEGFFLNYFVGDKVRIKAFRTGRPFSTSITLKEFKVNN